MESYYFKVTVCLGHGDGGDIEAEVPLSKASVKEIRKLIKEHDGDYFFDDLEKDAPKLYHRIYPHLMKAAKEDVDSLNEGITDFTIMAELPDVLYKQEKFIKPLDLSRLSIDDIKIYVIELGRFCYRDYYSIIATTDEQRAIEKSIEYYNRNNHEFGEYKYDNTHKVFNANEALMEHIIPNVSKAGEALVELQELLAEWIRLANETGDWYLMEYGVKYAEGYSAWAAGLHEVIKKLKDGKDLIENPLPDCKLSDLKLCVAWFGDHWCWGLGLDKESFQPIAEKAADEYFVESKKVKDMSFWEIDKPTGYMRNRVAAYCETNTKDFHDTVIYRFIDRLHPSYHEYSKYTEMAEVSKKIRDLLEII